MTCVRNEGQYLEFSYSIPVGNQIIDTYKQSKL